MNNGLYAAFLGMRARQRALDATASNIANSSTTGFKADRVLYRSIEAAANKTNANAQTINQPAGNAAQPNAQATNAQATDASTAAQQNANAQSSTSATPHLASGVLTEGATDYSSGAIRQTGRTLDVALAGDGFLTVQTPRGERYTRAGSLTLDAVGQLVTPNGELIVGERGAITVPPGEVSIGTDGSISVKGQTVDRLKLTRFNDPRAALIKEGNALFMPTGSEPPLAATNTTVMQGALESSNVNAITEVAAMMQNNREFETLQRSITLLMNDLGRKVANEIGRL
jgi:flagellar basal body rod protein FlgG